MSFRALLRVIFVSFHFACLDTDAVFPFGEFDACVTFEVLAFSRFGIAGFVDGLMSSSSDMDILHSQEDSSQPHEWWQRTDI